MFVVRTPVGGRRTLCVFVSNDNACRLRRVEGCTRRDLDHPPITRAHAEAIGSHFRKYSRNLASNAVSSSDCLVLPVGRRANQTTTEIIPHQPSRRTTAAIFVS
jgi:hypothetical protein